MVEADQPVPQVVPEGDSSPVASVPVESVPPRWEAQWKMEIFDVTKGEEKWDHTERKMKAT